MATSYDQMCALPGTLVWWHNRSSPRGRYMQYDRYKRYIDTMVLTVPMYLWYLLYSAVTSDMKYDEYIKDYMLGCIM